LAVEQHEGLDLGVASERLAVLLHPPPIDR
jgi:hypothetical protein